MTDYQATPEQWAQVQRCADVVGSSDCSAILELRARVEVLEAAAHKHIVETSANILALASRVEALEAAQRPVSKVYEISKPLQLTPEQAQQISDLLAPEPQRNYPAKPDSSLVERVMVQDWIATRGCAKSSAYKWLGILGIRPRREVNRATGKVESWLTNSEASILTAYADALDLGCKSTEARIKAWDSINARLVYRVNDAVNSQVDITIDDALEPSRVAIREVAAWLREQSWPNAASALEQEAER